MNSSIFMDYFQRRFERDETCFSQDLFQKHPSEEQIDFFYPNACQVCGRLGHLFRCAKCQMVSYCGKQHQTEHWRLHKYYCTLLLETRKKNGFLRSAKDRKLETWVSAKVSCKSSISMKLSRTLTSYEEKVIEFTRACVVCHDIEQRNLIDCRNCASVSVCQEHKQKLNEIHGSKCNNFKICYLIDLEKLKTKTKPKKKKSKSDPKKCDCKKENGFSNSSDSRKKNNQTKDSDSESDNSNSETEYFNPDDRNSNTRISVLKAAPMRSIPYLDQLESTGKLMEILSFRPLENMTKNDFEVSDLFTKPLSVFRVLQTLGQTENENLTIHMIGANIEDLNTYLFWEILFHLMPKLLSLKIVIARPDIARQNLSPKLCDRCITSEKNLVFDMHDSTYANFSEMERFATASLAIGFLVELNNETDSLKAVAKSKTPFAFTSNMDKDAKKNQKLMERQFGTFLAFEENSYHGIVPFADFRTESHFYNHQFLTIYKNLEESKKKNRR